MKLVFENMPAPERSPLATIGVCVKDCEGYVGNAVRSAVGQDFPHFLMEMIVVDDGSRDQTLKIVIDTAMHTDIYTRVFSGEWIGLGQARNTVVRNSHAKYIIWVDCDMVLDKSFVRKQTEFMENNLNIGIAKGTCGVQHTKKYVEFFEDVSYFAFCFRNKGEKAKVLGTGGSIYRSDVVRKVGGFDDKFRGVGEDIDLEARIRSIGWQLYMRTDALFYEKRRSSWRSLWKEYFWHGYGGYQMYRKTRGILSLYQLNPLAGFFVGALYSTIAFGLVYRKIVFLLPFQYGFKRIAWSFGFFSCQVKNQLSRARD